MEAALANMPWSEMKSILSDIEVLLEANEEADVLKSIKQLRGDLQTLFSNRESDARRLIIGKATCAWQSTLLLMHQTRPFVSAMIWSKLAGHVVFKCKTKTPSP